MPEFSVNLYMVLRQVLSCSADTVLVIAGDAVVWSTQGAGALHAAAGSSVGVSSQAGAGTTQHQLLQQHTIQYKQ